MTTIGRGATVAPRGAGLRRLRWVLPIIGATFVSLLAGCAAPNTPEACRVVKLAEVELGFVRNRPVVEVLVDGKPARFLLDTGASAMLITDQARERLGLHYDLQLFGSSTSLGARAPIRVTTPVALGFGSFSTKPTPFLVIVSAPDLEAPSGVDGLLGTSVLSAYDLDLDLPRRRLVLNEPRRCPLGPSPLEGPSTTFVAAPNPQNYLHVPVRIDDHELSLIVDSGANRTYLNVARAGLAPEAMAGDRVVPVRTAGPADVSARLHRFAEFRLGQEVRRDTLLAVGPLQTGVDGLLGTDYMRGRRVWLSFAGWAVTIQDRNPAAR